MVRSLKKFQLYICLASVLVVLATYAAMVALSQSDFVADSILARQLNEWREGSSRYMYTRTYEDAGNYLLLEKLPKADYNHGGVYFIGSSTMLHATKLWELSPENKKLIHNYAINSANVDEQFQWIKYLVEKEGLLSDDGAKTRIVIGLNAYDTRIKRPGSTDELYVDQLFSRHGLYSYSPKNGMSRTEVEGVERLFALSRMRAQNVILAIWKHLDFAKVVTQFDANKQLEAFKERFDKGFFSEDFQYSMPILSEMLDYLASRDVDVVGVIMPTRDWARELTVQNEFEDNVRNLFGEHSAKVIDLSNLLEEQDFADAGHANIYGQTKVNNVLMTIASEHLSKDQAHN